MSMGRLLRAAGLGLFLTLALGILARPTPILGPNSTVLHRPATLLDMKQGEARQPFVRRQLVPFVLRAADRVTSVQWRATATKCFEASSVLRPFLFDADEGEAFDSLLCLILWLICFTIFVACFESETAYYAAKSGVVASPGFPFVFTSFSCLVLLALLHNNYIYDPATLCFAVLTLRSIRRERFLELVILTALFSFNRETAFIVPGLTFFSWIHRGRLSVAFEQAALLSLLYIAIAGSLMFHYRHNLGSVAENNRIYLVHTYMHKSLKYAAAALFAALGYLVEVIRYWRSLPPTLQAVQWFVPVWIAMHILWGWPMEWRVFFEIYPGMMLTIVAIWTMSKQSSTAPLSTSTLLP
jgi:hypothetical protein